MKRLFTLGLAVLVFSSCGGNDSKVGNDDAAPFLVGKPEQGKVTLSAYEDPDPDWTWDMIAGQLYLAGTVSVHNDDDTMYVTYETVEPWAMSEAQLYVGDAPPGKGAPGQFPYKMEFAPASYSYTFEVPLGGMEGKSMVYIAAHATVGMGSNKETAWGGHWNNGKPSWDFNWPKKWGGGFTTRVMPMPELPDDPVRYRAQHYGKFSYWGVQFLDPVSLPPGSYFEGGVEKWVGWCCDRNHYMYANYPYNVTLFSTYDMDVPAFGQNDNWDLINYMINQRRNGSGIWSQNWLSNSVKNQFQMACWKFSDGIDPPAGSLSASFVADAIANGEDFIPGPGEFYGIIMYPDTSSNNRSVRAQMNIIEVDP